MRQQIDRIALQARRELAGVAQRRTFATLLVAGAHAAEALVGRVDKDIAARREPHVTLTRVRSRIERAERAAIAERAILDAAKKRVVGNADPSTRPLRSAAEIGRAHV